MSRNKSERELREEAREARREVKRPWEQGFQDEEFEQKQQRLKERGIDDKLISDYELNRIRSGTNTKTEE